MWCVSVCVCVYVCVCVLCVCPVCVCLSVSQMGNMHVSHADLKSFCSICIMVITLISISKQNPDGHSSENNDTGDITAQTLKSPSVSPLTNYMCVVR